MENQTVERVAILAYLDQDTLIEVDAIIVNDDLKDMDLKGHAISDFNDLETDVKEGLRWLGYQTYSNERHPIGLSYFENFAAKVDADIKWKAVTSGFISPDNV